jgi:type IV pilus assembly protein PilY1
MDTPIRKVSLTVSLTALIVTIGSARADDTDVYINNASGLPEGSEPMVMISIDYRPNLGSTACNGDECNQLILEGYLKPEGPYVFFDVLRAAMRKVFDRLENVRVGLMINHDNRSGCNGPLQFDCSNGGYIAMGFELLDLEDSNGAKERFHSILAAMPTPQGAQSHAFQGKEMYFEFFRYLTGQGVYNGHNGWTDFDTDALQNLDQDTPGASWDTEIEYKSGDVMIFDKGLEIKADTYTYESPLEETGECSKIYAINTLFQVSNQEDDSDNAIEAPVELGGTGTERGEFPDMVQFLYDADLGNGTYGTVPNYPDKQNVVSYFIVDPAFINNTTTEYARAGGTGFPLELSEDPDKLVATLQEVFRQILSVSTTFVAASVPVNVFNRAEVTDNVYIALFQVDEEKKPYWVGNVKKLRLTGANDAAATATLVDANGNPAIAADGRIRFDALTYWTLAGALPPADPNEGEVDGRDGRVVDRGGAGQRIPGFVLGSPQEANGLPGGRSVYYDVQPDQLAALNIDVGTASQLQADFGVGTVNASASMIAYARGLDVDDLDGDGERSEARPWLFGDALHSRPLPINYGSIGGFSDPGNPAIYLAVATNDGHVRMIRNRRAGGAESGEEVWSFMPRSAMAAQNILRTNAAATRHPYTVDGAPVAFIMDKNQDGSIVASDGDKVYLYIGMRRGGRNYYALDVTNPESPSLMWTIGKGGDFAELGYTFSNPRVGLMRTATGPRPILMFAGGYDMNKDIRGSVGTDDTEGNAIYVVDAETGTLIWKAIGGTGSGSSTVFEHADLVDSIPSTLAVADTDGDGFTDRMVVGDTGGNVWRADIHGEDTSAWKLTLLAELGRHGTDSPSIATDRRFFHRPDIVQSKDGYGLYDAVVIGSGNRADPLDQGGATTNYLYMIKDRQTATASGTDTGLEHGDFGDVTSNCLQSDNPCVIDLTNGWRLQLEEQGEKALATPLTLSGKIFFTTYLPKADTGATACSPSEGAGRLYAVSLQDARSVFNYDTSDDDPGNPGEPTSKEDRYTDLQSLGIPAEVVSVPPNKILRPDLQIDNVNATTRWRTFWQLQEDSDL